MICEKWDIFDENGVPTGRKTVRGLYSLKPGEYHLVVHIWVVSNTGKFLLQRRSENKKFMPGEWAATGGAAIAGEDSFTAASRELYEELGIKADKKSLKKLFRLKRKNSFLDVWFIELDSKNQIFKLQESEVAEVKWASYEMLNSMIENGQFHNYGQQYFNEVFEKIKLHNGVLL